MDEQTDGLILAVGLETHILRLYRELVEWNTQAQNCAPNSLSAPFSRLSGSLIGWAWNEKPFLLKTGFEITFLRERGNGNRPPEQPATRDFFFAPIHEMDGLFV